MSGRAGHVINDPVDLAALLRRWIEEKLMHGSLAGNGPHVAKGLTRQEQTEKLDGLMMRILDGQVVSRAQNGPDDNRR